MTGNQVFVAAVAIEDLAGATQVSSLERVL